MKKCFILLGLLLSGSFYSFTLQSKQTIVFFGDSLTAGYGLSTAQAFPAIVQDVLDENGFDYEVVNAGLSGETTAGGLSRIDWILQKEVDIFILELGANDALRGLPLDQTKENLQSIIDKVKAKYPHVKIVIAGMLAPPNLGEDYTSEFRNIFRNVAAQNNASLIPFLLNGVAGDATLNLPDGIHPNIEGHKIVANNVIQVLNYIL
jgi:acyl-CoA thioesterase-1